MHSIFLGARAVVVAPVIVAAVVVITVAATKVFTMPHKSDQATGNWPPIVSCSCFCLCLCLCPCLKKVRSINRVAAKD